MSKIDMYKKYSYLIGQRINKWTILIITKFTEGKRTGHTAAWCECECGNIELVDFQNVISGRSKDCGCGRKKMLSRVRSKDILGKRFGRLTVIESLQNTNKFGKKLHVCQCDCGNIITVGTNQLTTGHTNSCGCLTSYYNSYIQLFLNKKQIKNMPEYPAYIDNIRYRFDFYLPEYNLMIEYDGIQHFKERSFGNKEKLKDIQKRDEIKNKYCKDNNINILRIPYYNNDKIDEIISNHLQRLSEKDIA